jgi:hypothetical protein
MTLPTDTKTRDEARFDDLLDLGLFTGPPVGFPLVRLARAPSDPVERHLAGETAAEESVDHIIALEKIKAQVESRLLGAYRVLHAALGTHYAELTSQNTFSTRGRVPIGLDQLVTREIAAATGSSQREVARRLAIATAPVRYRVILEQMRRGELGLGRAMQVVDACMTLDDEQCREVQEKVTAPPAQPGRTSAGEPDREHAADCPGSDNCSGACGGGATTSVPPVSAAAFRQRVRRASMAADPEGADKRRRRAVNERTAYGRVTEDGVGVMTVSSSAERVVGCLDRADQAARAARRAGDERTLEQLRSDFVTDAMLGWWPDQEGQHMDVAPGVTGAIEDETDGGDEPGGQDETESADEPDSQGETESADKPAGRDETRIVDHVVGLGPGSWVGRPVQANVWIVVPFEVAAGLSDAPCELPGYGWVTAAHAREIITAPGSVWRNLGVDIDTGRALGLGSRGYRPSRELVEYVRARDGACRAPGCGVLARNSDLDHATRWPDGPTSENNLYSASRGHHNPKTAGFWHCEPAPNHGLKWTLMSGREYITYPKDWREALRDQESPEHEAGAEEQADAESTSVTDDGAADDVPTSGTAADESDLVEAGSADQGTEPESSDDAGPAADPPPF